MGESDKSSSTEKIMTKVVNCTLSCASDIVKLLPTGILFLFQVFSNLVSNNGDCTKSNKVLVGIILGILGIACFVLSFVDTFTDTKTGKLHYGIATINGIATTGKVKPSTESEYKMKLKDIFHALLAVGVFSGMALTDKNIAQCLYPSAESNKEKMCKALPVVVSAISSATVVLFPSKRQGISCPATSATTSTT